MVGMGNLVRSDDGVGVHALRLLQADPRTPPDVALIDGGTLGLELAGYLWGASRLLLIDSIDAGQPGGTLIRIEGGELRHLRHASSVHRLGVADLVARLCLACEEPPEMALLGVQPASTEWGTSLTPSVAAAVGPLVEMAVSVLNAWTRQERRAE